MDRDIIGDITEHPELSEAERGLQLRFHLDEDQLRWRRWCVAANCGGDEDVFCQEYPSCPEEAFLSSGRPVFDGRSLTAALAGAEQGERGILREQDGRLRFCAGEGRYLTVYDRPGAGAEYVIGCDVAAGFRGGDYSAAAVVDRDSLRVAACWHGHMEPELFGRELLLLARWYNRALLIPEANNHGIAVLGELRRAGYGRVFRRRDGEAGWLTTQTSKPALVGSLAAYIREDASRIRDRETISECLCYVYDEKGHANAMNGAHDDRVIALALAVHFLLERPAGPRIPQIDLREAYGVNKTTGY
ncbi:MAG: hypothetical protein IKD93_05070 [Firmicutes bacterium]|nr:hypothetical protein [Bacillota bacterium]